MANSSRLQDWPAGFGPRTSGRENQLLPVVQNTPELDIFRRSQISITAGYAGVFLERLRQTGFGQEECFVLSIELSKYKEHPLSNILMLLLQISAKVQVRIL